MSFASLCNEPIGKSRLFEPCVDTMSDRWKANSEMIGGHRIRTRSQRRELHP